MESRDRAKPWVIKDRTQPTPKQAEALALQAQGLTYWEISDKLGITPEAVSKRLTNARRRAVRPILTPRESEILELREQGLSHTKIANKLHISRRAVGIHLDNIKERIKLKEQQE
jgi:DNA-binding CsgD family transcriptional regulator